MASTAAPRDNKQEIIAAQQKAQLPAISPPRLPYHPMVEERFGVDRASWKALVESIFPNATSIDSVILALSYCRARRLDVFKRNVHIVPIWDKERRCMVDTIWPGIGELRTTAMRTSDYAGRDETVFGPDVTRVFRGEKADESCELTFPEWARVTVYRIVKGQRVAFAGPEVYWLETYATVKHSSDVPNTMWQNRPRGQIAKCAEAAALRAAFPEELGSDYIPEEVQHPQATNKRIVDAVAQNVRKSRSEELAESLADIDGQTAEAANEPGNAHGLDTSGEHQQPPAQDIELCTLGVELHDGIGSLKTEAEVAERLQALLAAKSKLGAGEFDFIKAKLDTRVKELKAKK